MEHTNNYELSKWAETDRILMEDFNMDHDKIDAAIKAVETNGLKIMTGSFSGTGTTGTRSYSIGVKPKMVFVRTSMNNDSYSHPKGLLITELFSISYNTTGNATMNDPSDKCGITEDGFSINHTSKTLGLNNSGSTLYYMALC